MKCLKEKSTFLTVELEVHYSSGNRTEKGIISPCALFNLLYLRVEKKNL